MSQQPTAPLPGAVGVTDLRVYDSPAPDGLLGGGPHLHMACTEAYCIVEGAGAVQTLGPDGVLRQTRLEPQKIVWFTPGVIHRLINADGKLRILVIMQNNGLPEAGDFVLTFPREILCDAGKYDQAASIAASGHIYASGEDAARRRRDLAVEGFIELQREIAQRGTDALHEFYRHALARVADKLPKWRDVWASGPRAVSDATARQLDQLAAGKIDHLLSGGVYSLRPPGGDRKLGMCGTLGVYLPEGAVA